MNANIRIPREQLATFCREHGIKKLSVFGSALGEAFGPESDIDLLVEFDANRIPTLFDLVGMELELAELFGGRKVDLRTPEDLSRYFRDSIIVQAEVQYAE
ncbi:MAG: nucleotidyltransferase family protein [Proteobacteria bacterium]|nr:nucleotidyltransferase family protein [Pseudomonadota bacterium]